MKKSVISIILFCAALQSYAQTDTVYVPSSVVYKQVAQPEETRDGVDFALNAGLLMGGGSLVGLDLEVMYAKQFGLQIGAGINSWGAGVNFHFKDRINSPYFSIIYWQQGFGENHYASYVGPFFTFRAKKVFQAGIGLGLIVSQGQALYNAGLGNQHMFMLYNIGVYFPL